MNIAALKAENQEIQKMALSVEAKESLMKMQRYNRFNYNVQTEKILKVPIASEVKRLEKIKNENKSMRAKNFDNELTIICLNNHIKMISEMNRNLSESNTSK